MGGGGSKTSGTSTQSAAIAPELQPLFGQTGGLIQDIQNQAYGGGDWFQFFQPNVQQIPGLTPGQMQVLSMQRGRAFGTPLTSWEQTAGQIIPFIGQATSPEMAALQNLYRGDVTGGGFNVAENMALEQIGRFTGGEIGQSPATRAAMAAVRDPVLNDLSLAGLGNSDAIATSLSGAYAPILAQELAIRSNVIPQLTNLGQNIRGGTLAGTGQLANIGQQLRGGQISEAQLLGGLGATEAGRQSSLLGEYNAGEEAARQIAAQQGQAGLADLLRRQGLFGQFTTGILSGFPSITGQSTISSSKQSGGGGMSVICTELRRQGLMDWDTYAADQRFGESLPRGVIQLYWVWAKPIARAMRRSPRLTSLVAPFALCFARGVAWMERRLEWGRSQPCCQR